MNTLARASAFLLLAACGGRTGFPTESTVSPDPGDDAAAATATAPAPTTSAPLSATPQSACMVDSASVHAYSSAADLESLLVGRWMMCNPGTPNPYWSAEGVGLDLLAGGRSYPLFRRHGSQIVRGDGLYVWHYEVVAGQGTSFRMVFEGGGDPTFTATLGDDPRKLTLDDGHAQYVFAPAE